MTDEDARKLAHECVEAVRVRLRPNIEAAIRQALRKGEAGGGGIDG